MQQSHQAGENEVNDMWTALERYQPYAEQRGFGPEWLKMTTKRTPDAVYEAYSAVSAAAYKAWWAGPAWASAAWAVHSAYAAEAALASAAAHAAESARWSAIKNINEAIAEETK